MNKVRAQWSVLFVSSGPAPCICSPTLLRFSLWTFLFHLAARNGKSICSTTDESGHHGAFMSSPRKWFASNQHFPSCPSTPTVITYFQVSDLWLEEKSESGFQSTSSWCVKGTWESPPLKSIWKSRSLWLPLEAVRVYNNLGDIYF